VPNYIWGVQLYLYDILWNKQVEILRNLYLLNRKWECCVLCISHCTSSHTKHRRILDILIYSNPCSLYIIATATWLIEMNENSKECSTTRIVCMIQSQPWILICEWIKRNPHTMGTPLAINRTVHTKKYSRTHTHTHTHTHTLSLSLKT